MASYQPDQQPLPARPRIPETDVLIVGAGPTGLVLAHWLARAGVRFRIVDRAPATGTASRALAVQARTLEYYHQLDLDDAVTAQAHRILAANLWSGGEIAARLPLGEMGAGQTRFPWLTIFPQDAHEAMLTARLADLGVTVERPVELLGFDHRGDHVVARLNGAQGEETLAARYVAGCDGARSTVRKALGVSFAGDTYRQRFYVADVEAEGPGANGELYVDLERSDFAAVFPLAPHGRVRLVGTVSDGRADRTDLRFEDVQHEAIGRMGIRVARVAWFSTYHVHHRVADRFYAGRAFLLGDAAHVHSPVGGQGMNTGIGDAVNLAWKLAMVLAGRAPETLLDSYQPERIAFARRLVATTDRVFSMVTAEGPLAQVARTRLVPRLAGAALGLERVRRAAFRTLSQIAIRYPASPLSEGRAGHVAGGDRLPWLAAADNHAALRSRDWQVHILGPAPAPLGDWCARHDLPLHTLSADAAGTGLLPGAAYLVRPDGHVALADPAADPAAIARYALARGFRLGLANPLASAPDLADQ